MGQLKCTAKLEGEFKVVAEVEGHQYIMDVPTDVDGTDLGASPMGLLLVALAGCKLMTARVYARKRRIILEECEAVVTGDYKSKSGNVDLNLTVDQYVKTDASDAEIEKMNEFVDKYCSVSTVLSQANTIGGKIIRK